MAENAQDLWARATPLNTAWEWYADFGHPAGTYTAQLKEIQKEIQTCPFEQQAGYEKKLEIKRRNLKFDFLHRIEVGVFRAFGRDVTGNLNSPIIEIPSSHFRFEIIDGNINWETDFLNVYERKIAGLRVLPWDKTAFWGCASDEQSECGTPLARPPADPMPQTGGARSFEDIRTEAILECIRRHPDFLSWTGAKRIEFAKCVAREMNPDRDIERGFGRSSVYATINNLEKAGLLPPKNVQ